MTSEVMAIVHTSGELVCMQGTLEAFEALPVHRVTVDGATLAYRKVGQGPPVMLVHGWPLSGSTWRGLLPALAERHTCYVPDLPGAGQSPWSPKLREFFADQARHVLGFVRAVDLHDLTLIGHDSGGLMARVVAADLCDEGTRSVRAIVLTNTEVPGHAPGLVKAMQVALRVPGATAVLKALLYRPAYVRSRWGLGGCFRNLDHIDGEFTAATLEPLRADPRNAVRAITCADLSFADELDEVHARIRAPLLCVWGDADPFFPVQGAERMVESWPVEARLEVFKGEKLFFHEEAPTRLAQVIMPWLARGRVHAA